MEDKIIVRSSELLIFKVPADSKQEPTNALTGKRLTLEEWKKLFPKPLFKWDKK